MTEYHQKITRFLGRAQQLNCQFEPRSHFMLTWSAELLLKLGTDLSVVTQPHDEKRLLQKIHRALAAARELLDELDSVLDEALDAKASTRFRLKAPRFRRLMRP